MVGDVDVVDLLVAIERLVEAHSDELDTLNVFPVPDADTGRNVLATVRAARVAAEQANPDERRRAAVLGALQGARGNSGALVSQLLRAVVEAGQQDWPGRLARADTLARAAVAHPVEGSVLTALRAAAAAAAEHDDPGGQLEAAVEAANAAVRDSPTLLEVLARAGVVDAGARAAALVLEAVAAVHLDRPPAPPPVDVPVGGPDVADCPGDDAAFEVMYLLDPQGEDVTDDVRRALDTVGTSVVVVAADQLVSVHVHTDDIGRALDVGLAHGRPHHVRVEDLQDDVHAPSGRRASPAPDGGGARRAGVVVGAAGVGIARLAADVGAITVPLTAAPPDPAALEAAVRRTGAQHVVVLPGDPGLLAAARDLGVADVEVEVAATVDDPARVVAALAVLDPADPEVSLLEEVANGVRSGTVRRRGGNEWVAEAGDRRHAAPTVLDAIGELLEMLARDAAPELATVLLGAEVGVVMRDAILAEVARSWPEAEVELVDAGLTTATVVVGVE